MKRKTVKKLVLFVCTGNTCRSPMAEAIFRKEVEYLCLTKLKVGSAGIKTKRGDTMHKNSMQCLMEKGIDVGAFVSRKINKTMIKQSLAIICMTDAQRDILMDMRWNILREEGEDDVENNVYSFADLVGYSVMDPYGRDIDCYRYVCELIAGGMPAIIEKILPLEIRPKLKDKEKKTTGKTVKKGE